MHECPRSNAMPPATLTRRTGARSRISFGERSIPSYHFDVRLQRLVARLHALGARSTYELLREVATGADLFVRLEIYARLDGDIVRALGGDLLPIEYLVVIDGDAP